MYSFVAFSAPKLVIRGGMDILAYLDYACARRSRALLEPLGLSVLGTVFKSITRLSTKVTLGRFCILLCGELPSLMAGSDCLVSTLSSLSDAEELASAGFPTDRSVLLADCYWLGLWLLLLLKASRIIDDSEVCVRWEVYHLNHSAAAFADPTATEISLT